MSQVPRELVEWRLNGGLLGRTVDWVDYLDKRMYHLLQPNPRAGKGWYFHGMGETPAEAIADFNKSVAEGLVVKD